MYCEVGALMFATNIFARLRGLLFRPPHSKTLLIAPCKDIHTFGMRENIDVAFIDSQGCVLEVCYALEPSQRIRNRRSAAVLERFASEDVWFEPGDHIGIFPLCHLESVNPITLSLRREAPNYLVRKEKSHENVSSV